jgi:acetyltransferase-like isoleucine patch superfamily enzyme
MKHSARKFPKFNRLPATEKISYIWFYLFVNNPFKWMYSSFLFYLKCRILNIKVGECRTYGSVSLYRAPLSDIIIGSDVQIVSDENRGNASTLRSKTRIRTLTPYASIVVGDNVGMNGASITARSKSICIGDNCRIGPNVVIVDSDFHSVANASDRKMNPSFETDASVFLKKNVWIGMNVIILKGVTIGENTVIGAGSVVTKSIPANTLAAGTPAKVIRSIPN